MLPKTPPAWMGTNISLRSQTYYHMGGTARFFATPHTLQEVQDTLQFARQHDVPCIVLGSGSNSVFADGFFDGVVLCLQGLNHWHWENHDTLFVEGGVTNTEVAEIALEQGRAGASWMFRMPGLIGASVRMNARCYGGEMAHIVTHVLTLNSQGRLNIRWNHEIFMGYKDTLLMHSPEVVVAAWLYFPTQAPREELYQHMETCERSRHVKHHFDFPSCGSTFKNNHHFGTPSGQIFDELGLKGARVGDMEVSTYHANFIWNLSGTGHTADLLSLTQAMKAEAQKARGAVLDLEVQPLGTFLAQDIEKYQLKNCGPIVWDKAHTQGLIGSLTTPSADHASTFPKTLLCSPFFAYQKGDPGLPQVWVCIEQLCSWEDAQKDQRRSFLKWSTSLNGQIETVKNLFAFGNDTAFSGDLTTSTPLFVPNLWETHGVSELFLAHATENRYLEFQITPCAKWVGIEFLSTRQRTAQSQTPQEDLFRSVKIEHLKKESRKSESYSFSMVFSLQSLKHILDFHEAAPSLRIQASLSLGAQRFFLAPTWDLAKDEKPDFHQLGRFFTFDVKTTAKG